MSRNRPGSIVFGLAVGLVVALLSYRWITTPDQSTERATEEAVVMAARDRLAIQLAIEDLEIVDPLAPRRSVGKTYVYPRDSGWEVSGYYRRDRKDEWHSWLMHLDAGRDLVHLKVRDADPGLAAAARLDPRLEVLR